ncbi:MAG: radical SAM family heme chaperone HemW [Bacteroidales bacterium]|jgi:oxygen-independent coproporphyrinogen-3 oxidase|nr:radical SAM family heme chaperone HemW [Bacteroidales bacterium]MDX9926629.1 radical SAM family heme chaperone HemW [Bacteroidales bacterium]HOC47212.1 radical SAM family heme chaperone HemW [Bacteroidales bacterium]HPS97026.1 radical SAM family heme chaperone HemW [Bacteroidales bacterium]
MAGIYIHIPFCKSFCSYCDFYSITDNSLKDALVQAVIRESSIRPSYLEGETVETVYFGGGTPSLLEPATAAALISDLKKKFPFSDDPEITFEVNPDDVYEGLFIDLKKAGINRISLGVQSWDDKRLRYLGRRHDAAQSARALDMVFREGIKNVSVDIIYGVPGMTTADLKADLEKTFAFPVTHLSAYHLTVEEGTRFGRMKKEGKLKETDEETSASMFSLLGKVCREHGFIHYEISNFAKEGYISRHNSSYWKQVPYLGLGPSAHSFDGRSRQWNVADVRKYVKAISSGEIPCEREELDRITVFNEYVMTSLRTMWGIDLTHVEEFYDKELHDYLVNLSGKYIRYGLMKREKNTLVLTDQGRMISDNIIAELLADL